MPNECQPILCPRSPTRLVQSAARSRWRGTFAVSPPPQQAATPPEDPARCWQPSLPVEQLEQATGVYVCHGNSIQQATETKEFSKGRNVPEPAAAARGPAGTVAPQGKGGAAAGRVLLATARPGFFACLQEKSGAGEGLLAEGLFGG